MVSIVNGYCVTGFFNSHKFTPVNCVYKLCDLEQVPFKALYDGFVNKFQAYLLHL